MSTPPNVSRRSTSSTPKKSRVTGGFQLGRGQAFVSNVPPPAPTPLPKRTMGGATYREWTKHETAAIRALAKLPTLAICQYLKKYCRKPDGTPETYPPRTANAISQKLKQLGLTGGRHRGTGDQCARPDLDGRYRAGRERTAAQAAASANFKLHSVHPATLDAALRGNSAATGRA